MRTPGTNVFARFKAKPGDEDRVRAALVEMIEPTLQENPNLGYALHVSNEDPRLFVLYEQWDDGAGLHRHMQTPHFAELEHKLAGALETPMEIITAQMIGGETAPTTAGTATTV
jgi:quinol monooxygenase YgiN